MSAPKSKEESDTESKNQRKWQFESHCAPISPRRRLLSIGDVPLALRGPVSELPVWLGDTVSSAIQHLKQDSQEKGGQRKE